MPYQPPWKQCPGIVLKQRALHMHPPPTPTHPPTPPTTPPPPPPPPPPRPPARPPTPSAPFSVAGAQPGERLRGAELRRAQQPVRQPARPQRHPGAEGEVLAQAHHRWVRRRRGTDTCPTSSQVGAAAVVGWVLGGWVAQPVHRPSGRLMATAADMYNKNPKNIKT